MRTSARALVVEGGKILAFERKRIDSEGNKLHYLSIPGGALEEGEDPEEAVVRELREELMVDVSPDQLVARLHVSASEWFHAEIHYFYICTRRSGEPHFNKQSEEAINDTDQEYIVAWRPLDQLHDDPALHPIYRKVMDELLPYLESGSYPATPLDITV